jgi:hypothetical protein
VVFQSIVTVAPGDCFHHLGLPRFAHPPTSFTPFIAFIILYSDFLSVQKSTTPRTHLVGKPRLPSLSLGKGGHFNQPSPPPSPQTFPLSQARCHAFLLLTCCLSRPPYPTSHSAYQG